jgi:hypothetical protein
MEHFGERGAGDVGIEQSDGKALGGESESEVGGDGAFTDATFTGGDGDDVFERGLQGFVRTHRRSKVYG